MQTKKGFKITKNTVALISREALNKGALFILLILIGRILGKEALGRYSLAIAISQIFFFGTELGLNTLVVRNVAKEKSLAGKFLVNVLLLRVATGILTVGIIWFVTIALRAKGETAAVILLCGLSYFFVSIMALYTSIFRAFEKMELELFVNFIKNLIFLPLAVWFLFNKGGLIWVFNVFLASNVAALIISKIIFVRQIGMPELKYDFSFLKEQGRQTLPLWLSQLFGMAYLRLAPLLLFRLKGEGAVGLYNAGFVVVDGLWVLVGCFVASIFPMISRLGSESMSEARREYLRGLRFILSISLPLGGIIILASKDIVPFFYGKQFIEIVPLFKLLTIAAILVALGTHNALAIVAIEKQIFVPFINGIGLFINFFLNIFLISKFSYIGSAYALIISESVVFILMMAVLRRFLLGSRVMGQEARA